MLIAIIVAATTNRVIGKQGKMPWHLPDDLRYFKETTLGRHIIMGRKTLDSFGNGKALPKRSNIVITRQKNWAVPDTIAAPSLSAALQIARENGENTVFIIGGGEIYPQALPFCNRIYLTEIHATIEGDTFFPPIDPQKWQEISRRPHPADERHAYAFDFVKYERILSE